MAKRNRKRAAALASSESSANSPRPLSWKKVLGVAVPLALALAVGLALVRSGGEAESPTPRFTQHGGVVNWWGPIPDDLRAVSLRLVGDERPAPESHVSNITRADYSGPESCRNCHKQQFENWSQHPHRWMNTRATESTVLGDFSGEQTIEYLGGRAEFFREGGQYRMRLSRGEIGRDYVVTQTIGSRFYQYYVGRLLRGPEPTDDRAYSIDHVLPFGYWLDRREWVPTVHVHFAELHGQPVDEEDLPSAERHDPFAAPGEKFSFTAYYQCAHCHTTLPLADLLVRNPEVLGIHTPVSLHFDAATYLKRDHPEIPPPDQLRELSDEQAYQLLVGILGSAKQWDARDHAVTLGISCEACHLGAKRHAEGKQRQPSFFPESPYLVASANDSPAGEWELGRTHDNLNWACGRCHAGGRRLLAGGMATWNSTEFTDAMRGSCYSEMKCVDCHNPHQATGAKWTKTEKENDNACLRCHQKFKDDGALTSHTHHAPGSAGSRCLDCHMPKLNEGLQDVVRTHMIFSPTQARMIEANQPNACNMCHVEQPIDWTLDYLKKWYGREYSAAAIADNYPEREGAAALGWLHSPDQSVRVIGADVLAKTQSAWALPDLVEALDDPFLINRQFARIGLERFLGLRLADFGYQFYLTQAERAAPLEKIREEVRRRSETGKREAD